MDYEIELRDKSTIIKLLKKYGTGAKKSFGQNFLLDKETIGKIMKASSIVNSDQILEIGPGLGSLTLNLCRYAKKVVALELEKGVIEIFKTENPYQENLEFVEINALKYEPSFKNYKIVANIPYNITGRLLRHYLEEVKNKPKELTLMVQKEVAEKIIATDGFHNLLSLSVQVFSSVEKVCEVPSSLFYPSPKVDSAVIHIVLYDKPLIKDTKLFFEIIRKAFQLKRKMLRKSLFNNLDREIDSKINESFKVARPQELKLLDWKKIISILH